MSCSIDRGSTNYQLSYGKHLTGKSIFCAVCPRHIFRSQTLFLAYFGACGGRLGIAKLVMTVAAPHQLSLEQQYSRVTDKRAVGWVYLEPSRIRYLSALWGGGWTPASPASDGRADMPVGQGCVFSPCATTEGGQLQILPWIGVRTVS